MSGGKKKYPKKRTYSEGELSKAIHDAGDEAVKRILIICIAAASDMFDMNEEQLEKFMDTMQRYINYQKDGFIDMAEYSKSLYKKTGVDIRLERW